jgi:hypothetical protein
MRAAIAAAFAMAGAAGLVWGCADEATPAPPRDPDAATDAPSPPEAGAVADGAVVTGDRAPTGCLLSTTGMTAGTRAENVARGDVANAASWSAVENALADDGELATVTLAEGRESATLRVSGFGFTIPDGAETWGIEVELKRRAPGGGVEDRQINVEIDGKTSRYKYVNGEWPTTIIGTHAYGQPVDTWGVDLYPADVNKATFAATLTVRRAPTASGPVTATVDSLKVAVHFCATPTAK